MINKEHIIEAENQLIQGIQTSDTELLDALLHDDLLFIAPNGQTITKAMDLASHRAGHMVVETLTATFENVHIIGDSAVVTVVYATTGTMMGNPIAGHFRYIRVWKMVDKRLQIIGGSCTAITT